MIGPPPPPVQPWHGWARFAFMIALWIAYNYYRGYQFKRAKRYLQLKEHVTHSLAVYDFMAAKGIRLPHLVENARAAVNEMETLCADDET